MSTGTPYGIGRSSVLDVPPPGAGLTTATFPVPGVAISEAVRAIVSSVLLTNAVVRLAELNVPTEVDTKPVPLSVRVKAGPPAGAVAGWSDVSVGAGLPMPKLSVFDTPPAGGGLKTATCAVPGVVRSLAGMLAFRDVLLT